MPRLRWRYAVRDLSLHRTRTLLVILSIAVGIFAFALISGANRTLSTQLIAKYLAISPASAIIHVDWADDNMVESIRRMPEVSVAEGRRSVLVRFLKGDNEWHDLQLFALEDYTDNHVDIIRPYRGVYPPPERTLVVERNSLFLTDAEIGDSVLIETSAGDQRILPIVGLSHDMNQAPAQITGVPYGYVDRETLVWLGLARDFNEIHLLVAENEFDRAYITDVAQRAADKVERSGHTVFWTEVPEPGQHFALEFLPTIILILSILAGMALVLSGFLVINVITAILTQQTRQIGVMKTIGARPIQVTDLYMRMVLIFGAAALLLAMPLGALGAYVFSRFIAGQLNFDLDRIEIAPSLIGLQIVIGLLVPVLAALPPISAALRITVREAITDQGLDSDAMGDSRLERVLFAVQRALSLSRPLLLSLRNTFRRKGRLIRTLIPLMLGGAIFMSVLSVRASLFRTLEELLSSQGFDVQVQLTDPYRTSRIEHEALQVEGVESVESWQVREAVPVRADGTEGDSVVVYALPPDTRLFQPDIVDGRWLTTEDRNAIVVPTSLSALESNAELGGEITLRIGNQEDEWQVVGVHQVFQPPIAPPILYVNASYFWELLGSHGRTDTIRVITTQHDAATHARVAQEIEDRLQLAGIEVRSTRNASEDRVIFTERFNIITVIFMIMATLLAIVGALGLMGTMSINVLERKREIGVMRAIGASNRSVLQIFVVEGVIIGQLSWIGALIFSQPMSRVMSRQIGLNFASLPLSYVYDLRAPLMWMVIVVIVAALASFAPARNAARLSVRETISYE